MNCISVRWVDHKNSSTKVLVMTSMLILCFKRDVCAFAECKSSDINHLTYLPEKLNAEIMKGKSPLSPVFQKKFSL